MKEIKWKTESYEKEYSPLELQEIVNIFEREYPIIYGHVLEIHSDGARAREKCLDQTAKTFGFKNFQDAIDKTLGKKR